MYPISYCGNEPLVDAPVMSVYLVSNRSKHEMRLRRSFSCTSIPTSTSLNNEKVSLKARPNWLFFINYADH